MLFQFLSHFNNLQTELPFPQFYLDDNHLQILLPLDFLQTLTLVIVLDNFASGKKQNLSHHKKKDVKIIDLDISKNKNLQKYFNKVDYVFHLAGLAEIIPSIKYSKKYFINNVLGTLNVLEASKNIKIKKFIYAASSSCYGYPKNFPTSENEKIETKHPYALTKYIG